MTKRIRVCLLIVLAAVCVCACAVAGCKIGNPHGSELTKGYDVKITYYANGGKFGTSNNYIPLELFVKNDPAESNYNAAGVPFMDIRESGTSYTVRYDIAHVLGGWYVADTYSAGDAHEGEIKYYATFDGKDEAVFPKYDAKGNPVYDSGDGRPAFAREGVDEIVQERNVRVVASDVQVTSARRVKADEPLVVCAVWKPALKVVYLLKTENGAQYEDAKGNKYGDGDEVGFGYFSGDSLKPSEPCSFIDATYRASYFDADCTGDAIENLNRSDVTFDDPEDPKTYIYAKYIDGANWKFVTQNQQSVSQLFNGLMSSENKFYIEENIDCSKFTAKFMLKNDTMNMRATIQGNGHTISNLSFELPGTAAQGRQYSIFGTLSKDAEIYDLKLSGITVNFNTGVNISYYAMWSKMEEGATLQGLEAENITATINPYGKVTVTNAQQGNRNNWLFGGVASDLEFLAAQGDEKVKVGGENTLIITGETAE